MRADFTGRGPRWPIHAIPLASALLLMACGSAPMGGGAEGGAPPVAGTVAYSITPGKPDAPMERISVGRVQGTCVLKVERKDQTGKVLAEQEVDLPAAVFESVWMLVTQGELTAFEPEPTDTPTFDFGEQRLSLSWMAEGDAEPKAHNAVWTETLRNGERVESLRKKLASLAREHAKDVRLFYFGP